MTKKEQLDEYILDILSARYPQKMVQELRQGLALYSEKDVATALNKGINSWSIFKLLSLKEYSLVHIKAKQTRPSRQLK